VRPNMGFDCRSSASNANLSLGQETKTHSRILLTLIDLEPQSLGARMTATLLVSNFPLNILE
jgi:hypothetical protein